MPIAVPNDEGEQIYRSPYKLKECAQVGFYERVLGNISWEDDKPCFVKDDHILTLSALKVKAQQLGASLQSKLKSGQTIMIVSGNCLEFPIVVLGAAFAGLKIALANPSYQVNELQHTTALTNPEIIFAMSTSVETCLNAGICSQKIIVIDQHLCRGQSNQTGDHLLLDDLILISEEEAKLATPYVPRDLSETQLLPFSSGTTGLPKAVEITHRNLVAMIQSFLSLPNSISQVKRQLGILPFFHCFGLLTNLIIPIVCEQTIWLYQMPFRPAKFCEILRRESIEAVCIVPPLVIAFLNSAEATESNWKSVKFVVTGAAPLDADTAKSFMVKTGTQLRNAWGMTEMTLAGLGFTEDATIGSVGKVLPGIEAKCVDLGTGKSVKCGERGEIWIRAVNVFKGYYKNEKATRETMTEDGWLRSGDVAIVDEKGNFQIVDRIKELIKVKGFQVAPAELEGTLLNHPVVATAAVVGIYDKTQATEWPRAYIELLGGRKTLDEEDAIKADLMAYMKTKISFQKQLRGGIRIVDKVPTSPSGKLLRKVLRAMAQEEEEARNFVVANNAVLVS